MIRTILVLITILLASAPQMATADNHLVKTPEQLAAAATTWINQSGSIATISMTSSGRTQPNTYVVTGHYINRASGSGCRNTPYPITGIYYVNTQTISFSVAWSNNHEICSSVTGWTGYIDFSSSTLKMITNWNLAFMGARGHEITSGKDTFTLQPTLVNKSLMGN